MKMNRKIGAEFLKFTQYKYLSESDQSKGVPQPPLELPYDDKGKLIDLPQPKNINIGSIKLRNAIEKRTSLRKYSKEAISMEELSYLLWCTQGVKSITSRPATLRNVPSAGARHPFETYILANNIEGLSQGVYRFIASKHTLAEISLDKDLAHRIEMACLEQPFISKSAATFIWVADSKRTKWRYGERGYRYMYLDAGHVCQNLYLAAEDINSGVCGIAAYDDEVMNEIIGVDGEEQFVIYIATVGKK